MAAEEGSVEVVKGLLEHKGVHVNSKNHEGKTPLHLAVAGGAPRSGRRALKGGHYRPKCGR
ncbi:ankyrin repeat domain-containing protein [Cardinium endosymbiont of Nabis limbatus]|uniref:ankyrin repeat domain-containing protein n=1 Tax=Cardinium endosymbiont of Nabis limbatus TaxID=3066217 RepID=UPI003AF40166